MDRSAIYRWVQRFLPLFAAAARRHRTRVGRTWRVDETYCDFNGKQAYIYRAIDEDGQVVDACFSERRNAAAAKSGRKRCTQRYTVLRSTRSPRSANHSTTSA